MEAQIEFRPHQRQNEFISLPDSIFEALYGGAAGGGKTDVLLLLPIIRGWYKHPKFKGLFLRRTFPELEREVLRRAEYWLPLTGAKQDKEAHTFKWPWGSYFDFGHAEHESDIKKYDSSEYSYIAYDELTTFTEYQYLYLTSRCRSSAPDLPHIVRAGSNPDGIGHNWVKQRFVNHCKTGYTIVSDKFGNKRIFIPAKALDNPYLQKNDPDYVNRLELLPEREKLAKKYGSWDISIGTAFDEFRRMQFTDEPVNAIHVIPPFDTPEEWPSVGGLDWGWTANTVGLKARQSPDGRLYITNGYCKNKEYISNMGVDLRLLFGDAMVFLDPSAWQKKPSEVLTIAEQFQRASGIAPYRADNNRISGKTLIHEYLRRTPKKQAPKDIKEFSQEFADKVMRVGGIDAYHKYLDSFQLEIPETNLPKLQIFDIEELQGLIEIFPQCIVNDDNKEDISEFEGDDWYDALRYLLKGAVHLKDNTDPIEIKKREIIAKYHRGEIDVNSFYRMMEHMEKKYPEVNKVRIH